jgi:hypothetical protein
MTEEIMRAIGRLESKVDGLTEGQTRLETSFGTRMDGMDTRVRAMEVSSAKSGAVAGGVAGVLVALGVDFLRAKLFGP